jgi:hypothetical protein
MMRLTMGRLRGLMCFLCFGPITLGVVSSPCYGVLSVYGAAGANATDDVSDSTKSGSAIHFAGGAFLSKDATLGGNGVGLELAIHRIGFSEKDGDSSFTYKDLATGFCVRVVPESGLTLSLGRFTHEISAGYEPASTLGSKTIADGKISGNFAGIGLSASFGNLQPYVDIGRYWLPKFSSKVDEAVVGLRFHLPVGG